MSFALGNRARVETSIDLGDKEQNKRLFDLMEEHKVEIENQFGSELSWEKLEDKRSSRIAIYRDGSIEDDTETIEQIMSWSIENLLKMKKIMGTKIKKSVKKI